MGVVYGDVKALERHSTEAKLFWVLTHLEQVMPCKDSNWLLSQTFPKVYGRVSNTQCVTSAVSFLPLHMKSSTKSLNLPTSALPD
ncbi:hypothetical protein AOLI_G00158720 [Acnodon oligacanthus]